MSRAFTVTVYRRKLANAVSLTSIGVGDATTTRRGRPRKAEEQLTSDLRRAVETSAPAGLERFDLRRGTRLERVRLELTLKDAARRKVSGLCPIIVEPRHAGGGRTLLVAYHPARQGEWFPTLPYEPLTERAAAYFAGAWAALDDDEIAALFTDGRDTLGVVAFNARPRMVTDELPEQKMGVWDDLETDPSKAKRKKRGELKVLPTIAVDVTSSLTGRARELDLGLSRSPLREELEALFGAPRRRSIVLVGPPGCGKSTLIRRLIADTLAAEGFAVHRNLDKVTRFYRLSGKTIIAGMSRVGDWEQRCVELCDDVRGRRAVLLVTDLHLFGRIGKARDSERALSDFFRGPVARGEVVIVAECTAEGLRRLEEDDPTFAAAFARFHVAPASREETFRMMLAKARELEASGKVEIEPSAYETILELGSALYPSQALPGKAVDLLARVAEAPSAGATRVLRSSEIVSHLSRDTGLPWLLLSPEKPLRVEEVRAALEAKVMGQDVAVGEAADLVVRIRAGLTDPKRPWGVYLFTGPTGTGKTELAKALAEYLYGSSSRLSRFDMSELSGPDAVARLIGDAWEPEGMLTKAGLSQPFGVVLLDEIEKAHPSVLNLLLQLFDEGRLTDAGGVTADFTHSIIVMTSNLGARRDSVVGVGSEALASTRDHLRAVQDFFPPEFFNRIDRVVAFSPLTPEVARVVAARELGRLASRQGLVDRGVFVSWTHGLLDRVVSEAFRAEDGARSLKRYLEDRVGTALTDHLVRSARADLTLLRVDAGEAMGSFSLAARALREAEALSARYPLEELVDADRATLSRSLREAVAALDAAMSSPGFAALSERIHDRVDEHRAGSPEASEALFHLDALRARGVSLHEHLASLSRRVSEATDWELTDVDETGRITLTPDRVPMRAELLSAIAEVAAFKRALREVDDPTQHAVMITLSRLEGMHGGPTAPGLLEALTRAYSAARGAVESSALTPPGTPPGARRAALRVVGLSVRSFFEHEQGVHLWHTPDEAPELVVVRVRPARPGETAAEALWDLGAESGEELRVVRSIRYDPSRQPGPLSLEDYGMGTARVMSASSVTDPLPALWMTRMAREEVQP